MRASKKRALLENEEPNLYDQDEADAEEATEEEGLPEESEEESHANGHVPDELAILETADEDELRQIISNIDDVVEILLTVPEWKVRGQDGKPRVVQVLLRSLTTFERTSFIKAMQKHDNDVTRMYPDLVILSVRHPTTKRLVFKNADRGMLNLKMGRATERMALRACDMNGLTEEAVKEMRKN